MKKITINILTIFPEEVRCYLSAGILNQAAKKEVVEYNVVDVRDFAADKHKKVDDIPYGGGPGMVMMAPVVVDALESLKRPGKKILLSPAGKEFNQEAARDLSGTDITLVCGRYTGIDHRVNEYIDEIISVGNFVISGGELPALMITEAAVRLIPGVLGDIKSVDEDKGYPVYTRPRDFRGCKVPEVLLSGDHKKIKEYRDREATYDKNDRRTNKEKHT